MKKALVWLASGVLVLLVVLVGAVWLYSNQIVGKAIERGGSYALGVDTEVGFVRLRLLWSDFAINRLRVDNPSGFDEPSFLTVSRGYVDVDLDTLRTPVVTIPQFTLEGIELALEREGTATNYGVIMQNLGRFESKGTPATPEEQGSAKRFIVKQLLIRDVEARVEWNELAADQTGLRVNIPQIELRDIGADNAKGVVMSELTGIIMKAVLGSVARYGTNLPGAVLSGLTSGLGGLGRVSNVMVTGMGKAGVDKLADAVGGPVGEAVRGVGGSAAGAVGQAAGDQTRRALGGLFGGGADEG